MNTQLGRLRIAATFALVVAQTTISEAVITGGFLTPSSNQKYAPGATLSYSGNVNWSNDIPFGWVEVDFLWTPGNLENEAVILDSESATNTSYNSTPPYATGTAVFKQSGTLTASQYSNSGGVQTTGYWLKGLPVTQGGAYYKIVGSSPPRNYYFSDSLGTVQ